MATGRMVFIAPALIAGVLNIVASVYLARHHGLLGVALGTMCAQVVTNNWYVPFYAMRQFRITFSEHFSTVLLPLTKLLIVLIVAGMAARSALSTLSDFPAIVAGLTTIGAAGLLAFVIVVLSPRERLQFGSELRKSKLGKLVME